MFPLPVGPPSQPHAHQSLLISQTEKAKYWVVLKLNVA